MLDKKERPGVRMFVFLWDVLSLATEFSVQFILMTHSGPMYTLVYYGCRWVTSDIERLQSADLTTADRFAPIGGTVIGDVTGADHSHPLALFPRLQSAPVHILQLMCRI